jgi:hypothetical protein
MDAGASPRSSAMRARAVRRTADSDALDQSDAGRSLLAFSVLRSSATLIFAGLGLERA